MAVQTNGHELPEFQQNDKQRNQIYSLWKYRNLMLDFQLHAQRAFRNQRAIKTVTLTTIKRMVVFSCSIYRRMKWMLISLKIKNAQPKPRMKNTRLLCRETNHWMIKKTYQWSPCFYLNTGYVSLIKIFSLFRTNNLTQIKCFINSFLGKVKLIIDFYNRLVLKFAVCYF